MKRQIDKEKEELQIRKTIKNENTDFLRKQIENNRLKGEILEYEE